MQVDVTSVGVDGVAMRQPATNGLPRQCEHTLSTQSYI